MSGDRRSGTSADLAREAGGELAGIELPVEDEAGRPGGGVDVGELLEEREVLGVELGHAGEVVGGGRGARDLLGPGVPVLQRWHALEAGQVEEGLRVVAEALAMIDHNGECRRESDLYCLKGELLLLQATGKQEVSSPLLATAAACFRQALDVACRQQAQPEAEAC